MPVKSHDMVKPKGPLAFLGSQMLIAKHRLQYTPDLHELNQKRWHLAFFPKKLGSPLGGMKRFFEDPNTKYLGTGVSAGNPFQMFTSELGQRFDQYIVSDGETIRVDNQKYRAHVEGFVLAVPVSIVCDLDLVYNAGYQTKRQKRQIILLGQTDKEPILPCWIWTYTRKYTEKIGANKNVTQFMRSITNNSLNGKDVFI